MVRFWCDKYAHQWYKLLLPPPICRWAGRRRRKHRLRGPCRLPPSSRNAYWFRCTNVGSMSTTQNAVLVSRVSVTLLESSFTTKGRTVNQNERLWDLTQKCHCACVCAVVWTYWYKHKYARLDPDSPTLLPCDRSPRLPSETKSALPRRIAGVETVWQLARERLTPSASHRSYPCSIKFFPLFSCSL